MNTQTVLALDNNSAQQYFLGGDKYVNFELPAYFTFNSLLHSVAERLEGKRIQDFFEQNNSTKLDPKNFENVNYCVFGNKDGEFAWRPLELIHPALYVALVQDITSQESWELLKNIFIRFYESGVKCESIPLAYKGSGGIKAKQVKKWWENVEQKSLRFSLCFQYVFDVDITDCYSSIYTHSIAWAIHGRDEMKNAKGDERFLGNRIDNYIRMMRYGQTNGIPQGSVLMDFIAEIVLGYIDTELMARLDDKQKEQSSIIRYRDGYKIFTNNPELGHVIVKKLSEVLSKLGMKLNTQKTKLQTDIILASVKKDKINELFIPSNPISLSKRLLQIYAAAIEYPNSGLVIRQLNSFYRDLLKKKRLGKFDDYEAMIGIITNLAIKNPRTYSISMAIMSKLLGYLKMESQKKELIAKLRTKFARVPNTSLLDVWLQRVSYGIDPTIMYTEKLTQLIELQSNPGKILWESSWLNSEIKDSLKIPIINQNKLNRLPQVIPLKDVALFQSSLY